MKSSVVVRMIAGLVLALAIAVPLAGQQKPSFKSGVEVVLIDVNVVDRSNIPVNDLKPDDFIVTVDRKPRRIVSAQFVRYDVKSTTTRERQAVTVPETPATERPSARPPARNLLIVIDTDSMEPGDGLRARQEAGKFVDKLAADDRVGVVTIPMVPRVVTMTKNRDEVKAALGKIITGSERYRPSYSDMSIGVAEAMDAERENNVYGMKGYASAADRVIGRYCCGPDYVYPCKAKYEMCPQDVLAELRQLQLETHRSGERSLYALDDLGRALAQVEGPKTLLLITGGTPPAELKSGTAYSRIGEAMAAAQVTMYTLYITQEQFGQVRNRLSPTAVQDMGIEREGVWNATGAANGTFMEAIGTFDQYFDRVVTEMSGSYLLGIEVESGDRDGRLHQVSVKVDRKNVEVRARKQYLIEPAKTVSADASAAERDRREVAIRAAANAGAVAAGTSEDLKPLLQRAGDYVESYQKDFFAIYAEERSELTLSRWVLKSGRGSWAVDKQRTLAGDYLLVRKPDSPGWAVYHDVFEVDGKPVRSRDYRLRTLIVNDPDNIFEQAEAISKQGAQYDMGLVDRSTNVPTAPLLFVSTSDRFVFTRQPARVVNGTTLEEIAFVERGTPTVVQGRNGDAPADGLLLIDPKDGRILRTITRWDIDGSRVEITVIYTAGNQPGAPLVPTEMREIYRTPDTRLECVTKYSKFTSMERGRN